MTIILFYYVDTWPSHFRILIMGDFALLQTVFRTIVKVHMTKIFLRIKSFFCLTVSFAVIGFLCYRLSNLFITDTKGTKSSVCIREVRNCVKFDNFGTMQAPVIQKVP